MVMERLTKTVNGVVTYIGTGIEFDTGMLPAELSSGQIRAVMNRLAAYEDTGMEPEDLKKAFNETAILKLAAQALNTTPDHLRDLIKAEKNGRMVVLPCKVGDKAWFIRKFAKNRCIKQREVDCVNIDSRGNVFVSARRISGGYVGETVFLTREEAEATLAQEGGTNEDSGGL